MPIEIGDGLMLHPDVLGARLYRDLVTRRVRIARFHCNELERLYPLQEDDRERGRRDIGAQAHFEGGVRAYASAMDMFKKVLNGRRRTR